MEAKEYFEIRNDLIENSIDEDGVFSEETFLYKVLPDLMEVKMIDSEDINYSYLKTSIDENKIKINGYTLNDSGERLQIFIVNDNATGLDLDEDALMVSLKEEYQSVFSGGIRFIKSSIRRHLELHDSDTAGFLVNQLGSREFIDSIDVIEIFLISPTITVETRGAKPSLKKMTFDEEEFKTSTTIKGEKESRDILIFKRLIDLNFLYDISVSKGAKYALEIDFTKIFEKKIEVLQAADEVNFESYLCVLPAEGIAALYRRYSTRLLEKNVRSFLNFRVEANSAMRDTIRKTPERFIAYNNGLTITATDKNIIKENGKLYLETLKDFQIVNGGQTTASIFFSKKDGLDISKINLMAKINIAKELSDEALNELISNISLYSNTQSKVSKVDLKSRNPQIDKIKTLSNSIVTNEGHKWFFEKARGEFSTMVRLAGGNKKRVEREFPSSRRLTKVELGKYYTAWGNYPWLVKKGGEKVFRSFIEKISGEEKGNKQVDIDRSFYESLIAKAILFRSLESIHGTRNNAIGQLRSAVVPYSISVLYFMFGGTDKRQAKFDLNSIWKQQNLHDDLNNFMRELMILLYDLIKKYATSDDLGENTRKEDLWQEIKKSQEIKSYISSDDANKILKKYTSEVNDKNDYPEVDFNHILMSIEILSKGKRFYSELQQRIVQNNEISEYRPKSYEHFLESMFPAKGDLKEMSKIQIDSFNSLFKNIKENAPHLLYNLPVENEDSTLKTTIDKIIKKYNNVISSNGNLTSEFDKSSQIAAHKKVKYSSSISQIGAYLAKGKPPTLELVKLSSNYFYKKKDKSETISREFLKSSKDRTAQKYYKKICRQDIERTPSISKSVAEDFFNLNLDHGDSVELPFSFKDQKFKIEINKRKTRNEYRFFINRVRDKIKFDVDDIFIICNKNNTFAIELIKKPNIYSHNGVYNSELNKMGSELHILY